MAVNVKEIDEAAKGFGDSIRRTPLFRSRDLEDRIGSKLPIYVKAENMQFTGSFKVRGALNKILKILPVAKERGVVTASAGNHAQGVAFHAKRLGVKACIVMPENTPWVKLNSTRQLGAEVVLHGVSYQEAYEKALEIRAEKKMEYVHAFNDEDVINGQGTVMKEILEDRPEIRQIICPIGGGGLIAGAGTYLKEKFPDARIIGVQAKGCSSFLPSLEAGHPVRLEHIDTIAEGMAVKQIGEISFNIAKELVDETVLVSDSEISDGLLWALEHQKLFVEGCGGAAIAATIKRSDLLEVPTAVILTGGNLDVNVLARIIERGLAKQGRRVRFEVVIPDVPGSLESLISVIAAKKASIVQVDHERVFGATNLREVNTFVEVETHGAAHVADLKETLSESGWHVKFE